MTERKKASLYYIYEILKEYTDSEHFLMQQDIIDLVKDKYNIQLERKSVANTVQLLIDIGFDINQNGRKGYYLLERTFSEAEIKYIIDGIYSSKSLSARDADKITIKVSNYLSRYQRNSYKYLYKTAKINRTNNKDIFCTIEVLSEAIKRNKKVSFVVESYDENGQKILRYEGKVYSVSPYYLVNSMGKYYLLANMAKYDNFTTFRIDYLHDVKIQEMENRKDVRMIKGCENGFDINQYMNEHVYMFGGESMEFTLEILKPTGLQAVYDWFGKNNTTLIHDDNKLIAKVRCDEHAFFYWAMQYSSSFKVLSPQSMVDRIKNEALDMVKKYS